MIYKLENNLILKKVEPKKIYIKELYYILGKRKSKHKISFKTMPSEEEHERFVRKNPYRVWFLIEKNKKYIGTLYLTKMNEVGIHLMRNLEISKKIISFIISKYKPLKKIDSVRNECFIINISPEDIKLKKIFVDMGAKLIQNTYLLK